MKTKLLFASALLAFGFGAKAQWINQASGFSAVSRGIRGITIVDANIAWAAAYDGSATGADVAEFTRTINGGTTWTPGAVNGIGTNLEISNITAIDGMTAWACLFPPGSTTTGQGIYKTVDGGATWTRQTTAAYGANSFANIVYFWDANNGVCMGDPEANEFEIYTTSDGGTTWVRVAGANIPDPQGGEYGYVNNYTVVGNTLWFGTNSGRCYKSVDMGLNWTVSDIAAQTSNAVADVTDLEFSDANNGIAVQMLTAGAGGFVKTNDGGTTWTELTNINGIIFANDISAVPGSANTWVSVGSIGSGNNIYTGATVSYDNGQNWLEIDTTKIGQAVYPQKNAVSFFNNQVGYAGGFNSSATVGGIYKFAGQWASVKTDAKLEQNVNVYPNPSNGRFAIELTGLLGRTTSVEVYNVVGQSVSKQVLNLKTNIFVNHVDISAQPTGVYFVKINDGITTVTKKLVKE